MFKTSYNKPAFSLIPPPLPPKVAFIILNCKNALFFILLKCYKSVKQHEKDMDTGQVRLADPSNCGKKFLFYCPIVI